MAVNFSGLIFEAQALPDNIRVYFMAHTKAGGSSKNLRDSRPKYLGLKVGNGQLVPRGSIILTQRGTKFYPGANVKKGKNDTLYAIKNGRVVFYRRRIKNFTGKSHEKTFVRID